MARNRVRLTEERKKKNRAQARRQRRREAYKLRCRSEYRPFPLPNPGSPEGKAYAAMIKERRSYYAALRSQLLGTRTLTTQIRGGL